MRTLSLLQSDFDRIDYRKDLPGDSQTSKIASGMRASPPLPSDRPQDHSLRLLERG
jgi:hypothetical protein